jgi:outer membrane lipoprotein SlyB
MNPKLPLVSCAIVVTAFLSGCTFPSSRRTVPASQANVMQNVDLGTVTAVREVNIEGRRTNLGTFGGAIVGGAAASGGRGVSGALVQAGASVAGAVAGEAVEEAATRKYAQEITIRMDDGRSVVVVQEASTGLFRDGDRVRVLNGGGGGARVAMETRGR